MDAEQFRALLTDGERFAPDADAVLRTVQRAGRRTHRRRTVMQIGSVAAAVVVVAAGTTLVITQGSPSPASSAPTTASPAPATRVPTASGATGAGGPTDTVTVPPAADVTAAQLATYRWSTLPAAPIQGRVDAATAWTGSEMLVWGGSTQDRSATFADGAAYNPATRTWRVLPKAPLDARVPLASVWTGTELFVWGGAQGQVDGAAYNPTTDSWRTIAAFPAGATAPPGGGPAGQGLLAAAVWTGKKVELFVWQEAGAVIAVDDYDPAANAWTQGQPLDPARGATIPPATGSGSGAQIGGVEALRVKGATDVWVAWSKLDSDGGIRDTVSAFALGDTPNPGSGYWTGLTSGLDAVGPVVFAGTQVLMGPAQRYEGFHSGPLSIAPGVRIDPRTGSSAALPGLPDAFAQDVFETVWTGAALLGYGSDTYTESADGAKHLPGQAVAYDPKSNSWSTLAEAPMAFAGDLSGVWTGSQLLVWGSMYPADQANTGKTTYSAVGLSFGPAS